MSSVGKSISAAGIGFGGWMARYVGWLLLTALVTVGGAMVLMLFKDWTIKSLITSMMAWPILGLAVLIAVPMAMLPVRRLYLLSAIGGGLIYNLILLIA